jgi:DNA-directed RNA polymerase subunit K
MKPDQIYTKYEKARMVGSRALMLSMGAPFLLKLSEEELEELKFDVVKIAIKEFETRVIPITIKRPLPTNS